MIKPSKSVITPDSSTQTQGIACCILSAKKDTHDTRCDERNSKKKVQDRPSNEWTLERGKSYSDVKSTEQQSEYEFARGFDLERVDHLGDAGN